MKFFRRTSRQRAITFIVSLSVLLGMLLPGATLAFGDPGAGEGIVICSAEGVQRIDPETGAPVSDDKAGLCDACHVCCCRMSPAPMLADVPEHLFAVAESRTTGLVRLPAEVEIVGFIFHPQAPRPPPARVSL